MTNDSYSKEGKWQPFSIFPDSVWIQKEVHFEMQINKQIITKLNVILRVSFKILKWIFPLLFLWQWSEFNVTTSSLTKRFSPFIPKKHWKFLYKAVILTRKFWTSYCPSLKLANYWIIIWALFLDNLRGQFSIFINEYSLFMNSCVKPNFLADQFHFFLSAPSIIRSKGYLAVQR